jgi:hypothetical protein
MFREADPWSIDAVPFSEGIGVGGDGGAGRQNPAPLKSRQVNSRALGQAPGERQLHLRSFSTDPLCFQ